MAPGAQCASPPASGAQYTSCNRRAGRQEHQQSRCARRRPRLPLLSCRRPAPVLPPHSNAGSRRDFKQWEAGQRRESLRPTDSAAPPPRRPSSAPAPLALPPPAPPFRTPPAPAVLRDGHGRKGCCALSSQAPPSFAWPPPQTQAEDPAPINPPLSRVEPNPNRHAGPAETFGEHTLMNECSLSTRRIFQMRVCSARSLMLRAGGRAAGECGCRPAGVAAPAA